MGGFLLLRKTGEGVPGPHHVTSRLPSPSGGIHVPRCRGSFPRSKTTTEDSQAPGRIEEGSAYADLGAVWGRVRRPGHGLLDHVEVMLPAASCPRC